MTKNEKKIIYFPIEVKVRELWPKLWLVSQVAKRNYFCILGDKTGVKKVMDTYPAGVYFCKSAAPYEVNRLRDIMAGGHTLVVQDEEAGIATSDLENFFNRRISNETFQTIERFYCWGKADYEYLSYKHRKYANKLRMTGSPRIDLWRTDICQKLYRKEIESLKGKYGDFILINSSFGTISKTGLKERMEQALAYGYVSEEKYEKEKRARETILEQFQKFVEMIHRIAKKRPNQNFVVRPHPSELMDDWRKVIDNLDNLFLVREGDVTPWIASCKVLIHDGCTTGIQGALMRKPVFSYLPESHENIYVKHKNFSNTVSYVTRTVEELLKVLDGVDQNWNKSPGEHNNKMQILGSKIANLNGKYAVEVIADDLDVLDVPVKTLPSPFKAYFKGVYVKVKARSSGFLHRKKTDKSSFIPTQDAKIPGGIQEDELNSFISSLEAIDRESTQLKVKQLGKNVFNIFR
jgi:surface carbohydrate biosynthesis protein